MTGHYIPLIWASVVLYPISAGLLTTLNGGSGSGKRIGYQPIYGIGGGLGYQQGITARKQSFRKLILPSGRHWSSLYRTLKVRSLYRYQMMCSLRRWSRILTSTVPDLNREVILSASAPGFRQVVGEAAHLLVLPAYNRTARETFQSWMDPGMFVRY